MIRVATLLGLCVALNVWPDNSAIYIQLIAAAFWLLIGWSWAQRKYAPGAPDRAAVRLGTWIGMGLVKIPWFVRYYQRRHEAHGG